MRRGRRCVRSTCAAEDSDALPLLAKSRVPGASRVPGGPCARARAGGHWQHRARSRSRHWLRPWPRCDAGRGMRRGEKERGWQPRWGEALDMYRKVMLVHGESKLASDTAFRGFTDDDWKKLEE